jgi:hypothetical protein
MSDEPIEPVYTELDALIDRIDSFRASVIGSGASLPDYLVLGLLGDLAREVRRVWDS